MATIRRVFQQNHSNFEFDYIAMVAKCYEKMGLILKALRSNQGTAAAAVAVGCSGGGDVLCRPCRRACFINCRGSFVWA